MGWLLGRECVNIREIQWNCISVTEVCRQRILCCMKSRKEEPVYGRIPYELRITYDPASSETDCECPLYSRHFYVNQGDPDRWKEKTGENYADIIFSAERYVHQSGDDVLLQ